MKNNDDIIRKSSWLFFIILGLAIFIVNFLISAEERERLDEAAFNFFKILLNLEDVGIVFTTLAFLFFLVIIIGMIASFSRKANYIYEHTGKKIFDTGISYVSGLVKLVTLFGLAVGVSRYLSNDQNVFLIASSCFFIFLGVMEYLTITIKKLNA